MNNGDSPAAQKILAETDTTKCPGCGGPVGVNKKCCPQCGRPAAKSHGFVYYVFWVALSLIVAALIGYIFYVGFLLLNRML